VYRSVIWITLYYFAYPSEIVAYGQPWNLT
jgi:hypothetical protein